MTKRKAVSKPKRRRRTYTDEFKQEAVKLLVEQQQSVAEVARNLGIHENLLRTWKQRFDAEQAEHLLTEDDRMEIARLRAENRRLRMERDILKKAAAFFANEKN
jgi:transposase